jgi:SAM-dependent methyltransferase
VKHAAEIFFVPQSLDAPGGMDYAELQRRIARSNRWPLKPFAILGGLATILCVALMGIWARLFRGVKPDAIDAQLGELYFHVPEMAIHKRIELDALARARPTGRGLDIGSGNGYVGGLLMQMTAIEALHGVDPVAVFEHEVLAHGYTGFSATEASAIPLPDGSFDFAVSICVLEHIPDLDAALREAHRLVVPGGRLLFTTPAPAFRGATLEARWLAARGRTAEIEAAARLRDKVSMHYHYADAEAWRARLGAMCFEKVEVLPIFSRPQLLAYEMLSWSSRMPELYFPDKIHVLCRAIPPLRWIASWATRMASAYVLSWPCRPGEHTHWMIAAVRGPDDGMSAALPSQA